MWGGPLGGGFMATGTNMTYSTAANWTHTFSNTFLMEVRGGTSYYHNEALTTANGQNLADQLGIKGVNLDEWTSGPTTITINNGFTNPVMGYVNSLPWDRWERTLGVLGHAHQGPGQPHDQVRRQLAQEQRQAAADAGQPGPARRVHLQRRADGVDGEHRGEQRHRQLDGVLPARPAERHGARPEGARRCRVAALGRLQLRPRQVAGVAPDDGRPRPPLGVLRPDHRPRRQGLAVELRPGHELAARVGLRQRRQRLRRQEGLQQLQPAPRRLLPPRREDRHPRRVRRQHDAVPRQPVRVQLPGQAEQQLPDAELVLADAVQHGRRLPGAVVPDRFPRTGSSTPTRCIGQSLFYVPNDLQQGTLYSWNVAFQREIDVGPDGRSGLRREHEQRRAQPLPDERGHGARRRHRRPAALREVRQDGGRREPGVEGQDPLQRPPGEAGPPVPQRVAGHQLVHLLQGLGLLQRQRRPEHPDQPGAELGPGELRPDAQLGLDVRVVAPLVQERRRRRPALGPRQLAGVRLPHASVGRAARHHDDQRARSTRRTTRSGRTRPATSRS